MLSINTNLSSLIAQNSMKTSTDKLNQAIERMSSGAKINHAKDNAANYSISTNMTTKIGAYQVAEDNAAMGLDMVTTASDTIGEMQNHAERLRALATQARNGTYGKQSLNAMQEEANAIYTEINRLYSTAKYNGISLFDRKPYQIAENLKQAGTLEGYLIEGNERYNYFIENPYDYTEEDLKSIESISKVTGTFTESEYKIETVDDLVKLAVLTNNGIDTTGVTFILAKDLDLKEYCEQHTIEGGWTPIGDNSSDPNIFFKGVFNGNGHVISNLEIIRSKNCQGLFGKTKDGQIKNLALKNLNIKAAYGVGGLAGSSSSSINNCYVIGELSGGQAGLLVGNFYGGSSINNCFTKGEIYGNGYVGGLVGLSEGSVSNSFSNVNVEAHSIVGGLAGYCSKSIINCYATGNVIGKTDNVGGLVGDARALIENSFASGDVYSEGKYIGGLTGNSRASIIDSYATGDVVGGNFVGGLVGSTYRTVGSCVYRGNAFYGSVIGDDINSTGSYIGGVKITSDDTTFGILEVIDSEVVLQGLSLIGGTYRTDDSVIDYELDSMLNGIRKVSLQKTITELQVGINAEKASLLELNTNIELDLAIVVRYGIDSDSALSAIDNFINLLSEKQTELGAVQNRLDSVLEEISTQYENLVSSRSTLRDADIAKESSTYIQQQILQQASATLMATANQSPAIALQLI